MELSLSKLHLVTSEKTISVCIPSQWLNTWENQLEGGKALVPDDLDPLFLGPGQGSSFWLVSGGKAEWRFTSWQPGDRRLEGERPGYKTCLSRTCPPWPASFSKTSSPKCSIALPNPIRIWIYKCIKSIHDIRDPKPPVTSQSDFGTLLHNGPKPSADKLWRLLMLDEPGCCCWSIWWGKYITNLAEA